MKTLSLIILAWSLTASIGAIAFENEDEISPNGNDADVIEIMKAPKKWVCFTSKSEGQLYGGFADTSQEARGESSKNCHKYSKYKCNLFADCYKLVTNPKSLF